MASRTSSGGLDGIASIIVDTSLVASVASAGCVRAAGGVGPSRSTGVIGVADAMLGFMTVRFLLELRVRRITVTFFSMKFVVCPRYRTFGSELEATAGLSDKRGSGGQRRNVGQRAG